MLTRLKIKNFKGLKDVDIELGQNVVFIGPNNSGKTTALQALMLWNAACEIWGVVINRKLDPRLSAATFGKPLSNIDDDQPQTLNRLELTPIPVPYTSLLWRNLIIENGELSRIVVEVEGVDADDLWGVGYEFQYLNEESLNCDLLTGGERFLDPLPKIRLLPPMSGLVAVEDRFERGSINRRLGEGRTAEVLRNLCYQVFEAGKHWNTLLNHIRALFQVEILPPQYLAARGELRMSYRTREGIHLDLSSSGRGMQQVLLLLSYMYLNPSAVLLLDEPDAHLEILRQREVYQLLTTVSREQGSQIIAASHSEVVLSEAADKDVVIAFVGKPHRINARNSQVVKALRDIPFDHYYQAEQTGWVLYVEGATDVAILRAFAQKLGHPAQALLERVFTHPIDTNKPQKVRDHFYGLREAKPDLVGIAVFDRLDNVLGTDADLSLIMWRKREIENYLCTPEVLIEYTKQGADNEAAQQRAAIMQATIDDLTNALRLLNRPLPFSDDIKSSNDFLEPLFARYYEKLGLPNMMLKTNFHVLADYITAEQIDPEVVEKLDVIVAVARQAKPRVD